MIYIAISFNKIVFVVDLLQGFKLSAQKTEVVIMDEIFKFNFDLNRCLGTSQNALQYENTHISFKMKNLVCFFSSPEPSGSQGELLVYPYGVPFRRRHCLRRRQQCLNIFSSETALPIKAKFYLEPPLEGGRKVYINGPGHMTKVAAMPIYGKNL